MLNYAFKKPQGILVITARGALGKNDFARLTKAVDAYLSEHAKLHGVLIHTQAFPDWDSLAGMSAHFEFVRRHHNKVKRVALVTDSALADLAAALVTQFSTAKVRHFAFADKAGAMAWLRGA